MSAHLTYERRVTGERVAVLHGRWSTRVAERLRAERVLGLELNYAKGYEGGGDLDLLAEVPFLETLDVTDWTLRDASAIEALTNLKHLGLSTHAKHPPDFRRLTSLRECAMTWIRGADSVFDCMSLRTLYMYGFPDADLHRVGMLTELARFQTGNTPRLVSCDGLESSTRLNELGLSYLPQLRSWDAIGHLRDLESLEIVTCRGLDDLEFMRNCHKLRNLVFGNCKAVTTLAPLRDLDQLEVVEFWESTNILDGDVSVLLELPRLREARFMNRRLYSHTREEIAAQIEMRTTGA